MPEKSDDADAGSVGEKSRGPVQGSAGDGQTPNPVGDEGTAGQTGPAEGTAAPDEGQETPAKPPVSSDDIIAGPGDETPVETPLPEDATHPASSDESAGESIGEIAGEPVGEPAGKPAKSGQGPSPAPLAPSAAPQEAAGDSAGAAEPAEVWEVGAAAAADDEIRRRLESVREWEEKQETREKEKELQREEIEKEYEQRRKEERRGKWKRNAMIGGGIIAIVLIAALLTFSVTMNLPSSAQSFPFVSTYDVRMPQGAPVAFADIPVTVSGTGDKVIVSISGGLGTELQIGDQITFSEPRRVNIRIFGITILETDYQVVAEFRGYLPQTRQNDFYVAVMTTDPLPGWAVGIILPDTVEAYPVNAQIV
ncbi:MAG TPA: hypothetical protein ENN44_05665 [Methanoculleus sp.]|nr:hypothetical protein [Methanoculleus sp.]